MESLRTYGQPPLDVALVHGGPGARGEMEPVARELAPDRGVLEPLQAATTLQGQVEELSAAIGASADWPVSLVGFSWGAWLSYIVAAQRPTLVKKLILVGSGPFEQRYVPSIEQARLSRLSKQERAEFKAIIERLGDPDAVGKAEAFARLGALATKTDTYDRIGSDGGQADTNGGGNDYHGVLQEALAMRSSGKLLALADNITCPVVAIHGDDDPHPVDGVDAPLSAKLPGFRMIRLSRCGHKPWVERHARDAFHACLRAELG